jgi:hypothetical protein
MKKRFFFNATEKKPGVEADSPLCQHFTLEIFFCKAHENTDGLTPEAQRNFYC